MGWRFWVVGCVGVVGVGSVVSFVCVIFIFILLHASRSGSGRLLYIKIPCPRTSLAGHSRAPWFPLLLLCWLLWVVGCVGVVGGRVCEGRGSFCLWLLSFLVCALGLRVAVLGSVNLRPGGLRSGYVTIRSVNSTRA